MYFGKRKKNMMQVCNLLQIFFSFFFAIFTAKTLHIIEIHKSGKNVFPRISMYFQVFQCISKYFNVFLKKKKKYDAGVQPLANFFFFFLCHFHC